ncbi:MAG: hypothetical protein SOV27_02750 [Eubacteriales bacterium]|nr:hypothetical protein [Eubacteriales bacterium]
MKKRKFNLLLEIATLCLCVAAIAIGVYSAKTASLNVSGTIGFEAHNVKATISAQIMGDGVTGSTASADGTPRTAYAKIGETVELTGTETEANKPSLALNKFYFSDMGESGTPADIYLKISVTNNSAFNIKVYFDVPNISGVTATIGEDSSSYLKLGTTSTDNSGDIVLKLSLNKNSSDDYDNLDTANNLNLTMHLEKYEDYYVKSITESVYNGSAFADVTTKRLCTQLGHGTKEDLNGAEFKQLEWFAFAIKGVDTGKDYIYNNKYCKNGTNNGSISERWYSLTNVNINNNLTIPTPSGNISAKGQTFWFIQQLTVGGGYSGLDASGRVCDIPGKMFINYAEGDNANLYANGSTYQSDIFKYLNNDSTNKCDNIKNNTFQSDTGISLDKTYTTISKESNKRTVSETYTTKDTFDDERTININVNFSSTFWLLSDIERALILLSLDATKSLREYSIGQTYDLNNPNKMILSSSWLRTPDETDNYYAKTSMGRSVVSDSICGIRAAFQITL